MAETRCLTFLLMDAPYESARTTTALRIVDAALRRGFDVNVFAYEGAVGIPFAKQAQHANAVHGRDVAEEDHPNPKEWVAALFEHAKRRGARLEWVQCGLCVDERGAGDWVPGPRRGSPADFVAFVERSVSTLVIPTR
ncbi:MAG: DsrE family protein [Thermodesulfobacteriota bacterium]